MIVYSIYPLSALSLYLKLEEASCPVVTTTEIICHSLNVQDQQKYLSISTVQHH